MVAEAAIDAVLRNMMNRVRIQIRLPQDMKEAVKRQAATAGIVMNLFVATAVSARVGAQAEAERYFATRASRTMPARAKALLQRLGTAGQLLDDDRIDLDEPIG
jgi:hypothetical protein